MEAATWTTCRADFVFDGGLIDLTVRGTGPSEWETFWSTLKNGPFRLEAYRDGYEIPLPETAAWIFAEREVASVSVAVQADFVTAHCHFFGGDLELDIDPREVNDETSFDSVLAIMRFVAASVQLPVLATPEGGSPAEAFLQVSPDGRAEFLSIELRR